MSKITQSQINPRLKMLYDMMPECGCMGDVGTDHGLLPIYCVQNGKCRRAVASDLRAGPLEAARKNIALYHCETQIETLLCPGLEGYAERECDTIVIAGMGGFTICSILAQWLASCKRGNDSPETRLFLLQPNTAEHELRKFLWEHAFRIEEERAVCDGAHVYAGIKGRFTQQKELYTPMDCYTGKIMCRRMTEEDFIYYKALLRKYENVLRGLCAKREPEDGDLQRIALCRQIVERIDQIIKGETMR